ncbi:beta-lactamase/transpeptidase-like protein [Phascolomyces articulosus]|uniref:Beta-lactamase/transpeptidase-like protein n=1 Tax=Phascolomyces articulosus TaxID=60185 RepID=A0AAD5K3R6_9FUNG|nr:beta-lactamase/transpeptidase-like protein [Phascolomyces articulosus]
MTSKEKKKSSHHTKKKHHTMKENNNKTSSSSLFTKKQASIKNKNNNRRTIKSIIWTVIKITTMLTVAVSAVGYIGIKRYLNQGGPFTPWTCSVFGYECEQRYDIKYHGGYVHKDYVAAEQAFIQNFYDGEEVGASVSAYVDGELVLDIYGGWQNLEDQVPYTENTLQMVFSSSKVVTAIVVARLVDQGILSYDEKITTYWPEFGQGKKENVTLGDLMVHAAGVGYLDVPVTSAEAEDTDRFSSILAAQPHNFEGERTRSYHAITYGWYVNEVLKRAANTTIHDTMVNELNKMYNIEWNFKPYQQEYDDRIAPFYSGPPIFQMARMVNLMGGPIAFIKVMMNPDQIIHKSMMSVLDHLNPSDCRRLAHRRIQTPAISGYTNAHSIAKLAAMMANGGKAVVEGEPDLLSPEGYALVTQPVDPPVFDMLVKRAMPQEKGGWGVFDLLVVDGVEFRGWSGMGGSIFFWNQEYNIAFGYAMNAIPSMKSPEKRSRAILKQVVKAALEKKKKQQESSSFTQNDDNII